jgi:protein-disulfide isomerase
MKSQAEIEARLSDCRAELEKLKQEQIKSYVRCNTNVDFNESSYYGQIINEVVKEIKILEWVLKDETKNLLSL